MSKTRDESLQQSLSESMNIRPFALERYFAEHEFSAEYLLSCSDCESLKMNQLIESAAPETKSLWDRLSLGYTESLGLPQLREEISGLYRNITADQIMTIVPEEGIYIAMRALLKKGDHIICTYPGYQSLYELARTIGCHISFWKPRLIHGEWRFSLDDIEESFSSNLRMLVVNFPHNPTGATITAQDAERIAALAEKNDSLVFSDEMYRFLEYDADKRPPSLADLSKKCISLSGMSKSFSLPGLRIGWLAVSDPKILQLLAGYKDYTTICSSAPSEILAIMGLQDRANILKRNMRIIADNLKIIDDFTREHPGYLYCPKPKAGPIAFCQLTVDASASEICRKALEEKSVMALPASIYDYPDHYFRAGLGRKNFPQAFAEFTEVLIENYHGSGIN